MKLSIVIPAYNEEARLGPMLDRYLAYFPPRYGDDVELMIVVNGSVDGTEAVARAYAGAHSQIKVIVEPQPIGKGGAVMMGFKEARGQWIGFVDADGATPPEAFDDLVSHIGEAGCIIANRWHPDSDIHPRQPLSRRISSRLFNALVRWFFKLRITDTQCGAKLLTAEAVRLVLPELGITRWAFDVDLLFKLRRAGFPIVERSTTWHDVAGSKVRIARASTEMILAMCRLRLLYSPFRFLVGWYDASLGRLIHLKP